MKQESLGQSVTDHQQSNQPRKEQIDKKRKIRKQKTHNQTLDLSDVRNIDTKKLTRQERAKVQKVKNRQAAQRSRDQHKQYVIRLEKEIRQLREIAQNSRNICWRCKKQLQDSTSHDSSHSDRHFDQKQKVQSNQFQFQADPLQLPIINNANSFLQEDSLMRVQEQSNSYPYFKVGFFVFALVAVLCVGIASNNSSGSRALMALPNFEGNQPQGLSIDTLKKMEQLNKSKQITQNDTSKTAMVRVQSVEEHGLIALNSDCIKSLMKVEEPQLNKNSLTTYNNNHHTQNYLTHQEGILLCSVRMPKPYSTQNSQRRTPLVRLYLLGSQIRDLITNFNLMIPVRDSENIQEEGIYEILARIKQVNKVTNHNCLL